MHGPPLDSPSCAGTDHASPTLTLGTPDANGQPAQSVGAVRLGVTVGNPATSADEADVVVEANLTDVRLASDLSDYTGELQVRIPLRITDRLNAGTAPNRSGTLSDTHLTAALPCAGNASSVGSTCTVTTTVDALVPGAVPEGRRAVWQIGQLEVYDGGPDGDADTSGNSPFARQGVFVP